MSKKFIAIALVAAAIVAIGIFYLDYYAHFQDRFLPGTRINDIKVKGMDLDTAMGVLERDYTLAVSFRGSKDDETVVEKIQAGDIDYVLNIEPQVQAVLQQQSFGKYLESFVRKAEYSISNTPEFDREKLLDIVRSWPEMDESRMEKPKNAFIRYKDKDFNIVPETKGTWLYTGKVEVAVEKAVTDNAEDVNVEEIDGAYKEAKVKADDEVLTGDLETVREMDWNTVTYKLPKGKKVLDPNTTMKWLKRGDDGLLDKKEGRWKRKIRKYVANLAEEVDTVDKKHPFRTHSGRVIKLKARGYYGWQINQEAEIDRLTEDLESSEPVKRKPVYSLKEAADYDDNYGYGGTYVEVNLSKQHLWMYKKGKVILESDVVSGTQGAHATPDGAYFVLDKARNVVLRGPQVKTKAKKDKKGKVLRPAKTEYEWESPVSYWMPLTYEGVGMHDASWRGAFGGDIWIYNGSHGCINLPVSFAPQLYSKVRQGTPVAVYY